MELLATMQKFGSTLGGIRADGRLSKRKVEMLSARSYVQDGLIAMWDGIENAGWGTHDSSRISWKDLIGGMDVVSDMPLSPTTRHWTDNAFVFELPKVGQGLHCIPSEAIKEAGKSAVITVEIAAYTTFSVNERSENTCLFQVSNSATIDGLIVGVINSGSNGASVTDEWVSGRATVPFTNLNYGYRNHKFTTSYACNGSIGDIKVKFLDGFESDKTVTNSLLPIISSVENANALYIGSYAWTTGRSRIFVGGIHNVRVYERTLSDTERSANFEIDVKRFGLEG